MAKVRRREAVPPGAPVPLELVSVPNDQILIVRFLGPPLGILTHWGKHGAIACPGPEECESKLHRGRTIWKGFAPAEYYRPEPYGDWAPGVLEVTERLYELMDGHELRGEVWKLERAAGRYGFREVKGEVAGEVNADYLRPPFPVEPVVSRVYRSTRILFGVDPPLPPRILLPAGAGELPASLQQPKKQQQGPRVSLKELTRQMAERNKGGPAEAGKDSASLPPGIAARIGAADTGQGDGAAGLPPPRDGHGSAAPLSPDDDGAADEGRRRAHEPSRNGHHH